MLLLPLVLLPLTALFVSAPLLVPLLFRALDFSSRPLLSSNFPFNLCTSPHQSKLSVQPAVYLLNTTFSSNVTTSRNASLSHGLFPVLDPVMFSSTKATIVYDVLRWNKRAIICGLTCTSGIRPESTLGTKVSLPAPKSAKASSQKC